MSAELTSLLGLSLIASVLISISCGLIGPLIIAKRITHIAAAIAHTALGGMGAAVYFGTSPLAGAFVAASMAALLIWIITIRAPAEEGTMINLVWAVGMAVGILFLYYTPGYSTDLSGYLFGNLLLVTPESLVVLVAFNLVVLVGLSLFYYPIGATIFDPDLASLRGVNVKLINLVLLLLTAAATVMLIHLVGLIMVIALLSVPATLASYLGRSLIAVMFYSIIICLFASTTGILVSYQLDIPTGPTIVIGVAILYFFGILSFRVLKGGHHG